MYKRKYGWAQKIKIKYSKNQIEMKGGDLEGRKGIGKKRRNEGVGFSEMMARQPTSTGASTQKQGKFHH